jgi:hypothetical protein
MGRWMLLPDSGGQYCVGLSRALAFRLGKANPEQACGAELVACPFFYNDFNKLFYSSINKSNHLQYTQVFCP